MLISTLGSFITHSSNLKGLKESPLIMNRL